MILHKEKKRKKITEFIRFTPSVIAILAGMLLRTVTIYAIEPLGYAVALLFADYYVFRRLSFVDSATGFYNEKYITLLEKEAEKSGIHDVTVMRFKTAGDRKKLARILRYWGPEFSRIVAKDNGEFLVISELHKKDIAERFMDLVREDCEKEGIEAESSYEMIRR